MKYNHFKLKLRSLVAVLAMFVFGVSANAQQISVSGVVKDAANGDPILGASVIQKGGTKGVITNLDGVFTIAVPSNATLVVKYLGYLPVEVPVSGKTTLVIQLKENSVALGEVVAIGYGVVKKNDATGSISAIRPDKLNKGLTTNAQDLIAGKIAGVVVTSGGGTPGGGATIRIRGGSSLNASNDPLYVIDGLAMDNEGIKGVANPLSTINPNDIESFTVLKDASATAIYGSRASNGVILITTKKGDKNSKLQISYDGNLSVSSVKKKYNVMNGPQFKAFVDSVWAGADAGSTDIRNKLGNANTDWYSQIFQTALSHDHNLSFMGGIKNLPYRASIGYTNQDGIIRTSNFERLIGSININPSFLQDHLKLNVSAKGMLVKNRYADGGVVGAAAAMDPTQPVTSADPIFAPFGGYFQWRAVTGTTLATANPAATLNQRQDVANSKDFIGSADLDYKFHFLPELRAHLGVGMESSYGIQTLHVDSMAVGDYPYGRKGFDRVTKSNKSLNFYLQYSKEIGKHNFDLMGGYEWQHFYREGNYQYQGLVENVYNAALDKYVGYNYQAPTMFKTESYLVSFFGRANYNYDGKYLATVTVRNDGSSRFSQENRWGLFPSVALAWKISQEEFLKDNQTISDFKLRLGYGVTGQQNIGLGDYPYIPVYTENINGAYYPIDSVYYGTSRPDAYNKKLKWEETKTTNIGIDFGILSNKITASLDYYFRESIDLINVVSVPAGTNFKNKVVSNVGNLQNNGLELTINAKPFTTKDFSWDIAFNASYNKNLITKLTTGTGANYFVGTGGTFQGSTQGYAVGQAAFSYYVYKQKYDTNGKPIETGAYKDPSNPSLGKYTDKDAFVNLNSSDTIINEKDRYYFHNASPDVTLGLSSRIVYKNFDFGFTLRASIGNYMYNGVEVGNMNVSKDGVYSSLGYFSNRTLAAFPANFQGQSAKAFMSDYFVQNASFLRCDNLTFGYTFKNLFKVISSGRIYATVQNPFVITGYKGLDPEVYGGIDNNIYPRPLITVFGVSLNF
jgi:TonB-dependent starch-binding outer membrane protein SusC